MSDTQSICASLNKSLLFHPRVAEEAQNLLSVHDEERIELLANAIAQTNTDQMFVPSPRHYIIYYADHINLVGGC